MVPPESANSILPPGEAGRRRDDLTLRNAFDALQLGVLISDPSGLIIYVNPAAATMHGYDAAELIGQPARMLGAAAARRTLALDTTPDAQHWIGEALNVKKGGELFPVLVGSDLLVDASGQTLGTVIIYQDVSEQKRQEEAAIRASLRDPLTGLASRAFLLQLLERMVQRRRRHPEHRFAVLYLDLDRFALINNSLGHAAGDALLTEVARRLAASTRPNDIVARVASDEFVALLDDIRDESDGSRVAQRWLAALEQPFPVVGGEVFLAATIGIALSDAAHEGAEPYLTDASVALQRARSQGVATYQVSDPEAHQRSAMRLRLETDLRRAIEHDQLRVFYQPIVDLRSERVVGLEALVRWQHDERGLLPPAEFISVAEETGLILPIGAWVLRSACRQLAAWRQRWPGLGPLTVNVNVSARHLRQADIVDQVRATLAETGLPPENLKLEITETMLMDDAESQLKAVGALRHAAIGVVIDDFGTGYSSLSYLRRFRVDTLKIDRSFVRASEEAEAWAIVSMIVALARWMGISVVAEGVEQADQKLRLRELGCELAQGYLFGRPADADATERLLGSPP